MLFFPTLLACIGSIYGQASIGRIIGGQDAEQGQFPWQVAINKQTKEGSFFCGGALISDEWILTAGQCVDGATSFVIQLGSNTLRAEDQNRLTLNVSSYVVHDRYNPSTLAHDLGLIKLKEPINFTNYIQSIRHAQIGYVHSGVPGIVAGWGQNADNATLLSDRLNFVPVDIISEAECRSVYGSQLRGGMTCAKGSSGGGICFGDIGGPLVTRSVAGDEWVLIGIASFVSNNGCESTDPSGFTRTDAYFNWVTDAQKRN